MEPLGLNLFLAADNQLDREFGAFFDAVGFLRPVEIGEEPVAFGGVAGGGDHAGGLEAEAFEFGDGIGDLAALLGPFLF